MSDELTLNSTVVDLDEEDTAEFAASQGKYQIVADYTFDWEMWHLPDGTLEYCSPSCERITGYPPERFLDDPEFLLSIMPPDDREAWLSHKHMAVCKDKAGPAALLFRVVRPDGSLRWVEHLCQPVYSEGGRSRGVRSSNRDVTDRTEALAREKELLHQLEERNRYLEESRTALRHTLSQLEVERKRVHEDLLSSIHNVLLPLLERLEVHGSALDREFLRLLRSTIEDLSSPMSRTLTSPQFRLTPRELEVCNMIQRGLTSKDIARILNTSFETVRTQRRNIRSKLGITDTGQNLETFLRSLAGKNAPS
jgi:PAS domain S-box-containing protein